MRILVTGAGGFVGGILVPTLVGEGHDVISATRDVTKVSAGIPFEVISVAPETDWAPALVNVDTVVHLAARAHVLSDTASDPLAEHRRVNTEGTRRLAQQAAKAGVKRFVFLSSIGVLGNSSLNAKNGLSFTEEDDPCPHDDYSRSKWEAEEALQEIQDLETVVIRPPLIYGPRVPGNLSRLLGLIHQGRPFPLGGVHNKRSLVGARNLSSFIAAVLTDSRAAGEKFLLADEEQLSTAQLYECLCRHMSVPSKLVHVPEWMLRAGLAVLGRKNMADRLCHTLLVDCTKAEAMGWRQPTTMDEGLREMANCFQTQSM
jgi:nucleoside-diphosphate-sugar epimerase